MIRTLIIDDEPAIRKDLQALLALHPGFTCIGGCGSIAEAKILISATDPDLVLLDINLSDGTGFDLLAALPAISFKIIFITAYNDQAIKAIKFGALDYLVKPVNDEEFAHALEVCSRNTVQQQATQLSLSQEQMKPVGHFNRIALRSQYFLQIVAFDEINYCQGDSGYTTFYLTDKRKIVVSKSLKEYEELLPDHIFIRTHQSYLVNQLYINLFHKDGYVVMKSGEQIPVATRKKDHLIKVLTKVQ